jgi:maltose O-acetyltransferase
MITVRRERLAVALCVALQMSPLLGKIRRRFQGSNDPRAGTRAYIDSLRERGMTIGDDVVIFDSIFDYAYPFLITIGNHCTLSGAEIMCHDDSSILFLGRTTAAPAVLGDNVFVGRRALILAGVMIGSNVIVGARAIVTHDVPDGMVVAGNPARPVGTVGDLMRRRRSSDALVPYDLPSNHITGRARTEVIETVRAMYRQR